MQVWTGNAYAEMHGAPRGFLASLRRHLSVPIEPGTKLGERFGGSFWHNQQCHATLVHDNRVATGLVPYVEAIARHYGITYELRDVRERPADQHPWWSISGVAWRPYQDAVHKRVVAHGRGVINAPPRSGKTLMAARAIDALALPTLYVAPSLAIVRQTYGVLKAHFGEDFVSRVDGEAKKRDRDLSKPIVVATAPSAVKLCKEFYDSRDVLIIDEFHHAAAETYHRINALAEHVYYRLMFTGTHFRTGVDEMAMHAVSSRVLYRITVQSLVSGGYLAPSRVLFAPMRVTSSRPKSGSYADVYQAGIVDCEERNRSAIHIATTLGYANAIPTIVLARRRAHADSLAAAIPDSRVVKGGEGALTSKAVQDFNDGKFNVLVGTSVIGEGVDVPRASALVYVAGGGEGVQMMQSYFRPLTAHRGKRVGLIYDFDDRHHRMLMRQAAARRRLAEDQLGNVIALGQ